MRNCSVECLLAQMRIAGTAWSQPFFHNAVFLRGAYQLLWLCAILTCSGGPDTSNLKTNIWKTGTRACPVVNCCCTFFLGGIAHDRSRSILTHGYTPFWEVSMRMSILIYRFYWQPGRRLIIGYLHVRNREGPARFFFFEAGEWKAIPYHMNCWNRKRNGVWPQVPEGFSLVEIPALQHLKHTVRCSFCAGKTTWQRKDSDVLTITCKRGGGNNVFFARN